MVTQGVDFTGIFDEDIDKYVILAVMANKPCADCGVVIDGGRGNRRMRCPPCKKKRHRLASLSYYHKNSERYLENYKKKYRKDSEIFKRRSRKYRADNREKFREYQRKYALNRPDYWKKYHEDNPGKKKLISASLRAKKFGVKDRREAFPIDWWHTMLYHQNGVCLVPGCGVCEGLEMDHIVALSRGGPNSPDNVQLLCEFHNRSAGAYSSDHRPEWMRRYWRAVAAC